MAGLGRKVFTAGQVLAAADVQGYLQDQSVQVYASSTARSTVVGTAVSEGMFSYLAASSASVDTANQIDFYNGSAWESIYTPGINGVINGGFDIWQRATNPSAPSFAHTSTIIYGADRWGCYRAGYATGATTSRQLGPALFKYSARVQRDSGNISTAGINYAQPFESNEVGRWAGQTVTVSAWVRKGSDYSAASSNLSFTVTSGTGTDQTPWVGLTSPNVFISQTVALTVNWQRISFTGVVPSNATSLVVAFSYTPVGTASTNDYFEVTGVQLEAGSVATPFRRAGGTYQGELAACQRYYTKVTPTNNAPFAFGFQNTTTTSSFVFFNSVTMRTVPTMSWFDITISDLANYSLTPSLVINTNSDKQVYSIDATHTAAGAAFRPNVLRGATGSSYITFTAEL